MNSFKYLSEILSNQFRNRWCALAIWICLINYNSNNFFLTESLLFLVVCFNFRCWNVLCPEWSPESLDTLWISPRLQALLGRHICPDMLPASSLLWVFMNPSKRNLHQLVDGHPRWPSWCPTLLMEQTWPRVDRNLSMNCFLNFYFKFVYSVYYKLTIRIDE